MSWSQKNATSATNSIKLSPLISRHLASVSKLDMTSWLSVEMTDGDGIETEFYLKLLCRQNTDNFKDFGARFPSEYRPWGRCAVMFLQKPLDMTGFKYKVLAYLKITKVLSPSTLSYASIKLNPKTGTLFLSDSSQTHLREKKQLSWLLLRHRPKIVTKDMIIDYVLGDTWYLPTHSTIDVYDVKLTNISNTTIN